MNCDNCDKENPSFRCSRCKESRYCSSECQRAHWKAHKLECQVLQNNNNNNPVNCEKPTPGSKSTRDTIQVVVVQGDQVESRTFSKSEYEAPGWEVCKVPTMCGVPLKVKRLYMTDRHARDLAIFLMVDPVTGLADSKWQLSNLDFFFMTLVLLSSCFNTRISLILRLWFGGFRKNRRRGLPASTVLGHLQLLLPLDGLLRR